MSAGAAAQDLAAALGGASSLAAFPVAPTAGGASSSHASVGSTTGSSPPIRAFAGEGPSAAARALRRESAESAASVATLAAAARAADVVDVDDGDDGAYVEPSPFPNLCVSLCSVVCSLACCVKCLIQDAYFNRDLIFPLLPIFFLV